MKKYISFILAAAMMLCLAACSGGEQSQKSSDFSVQAAMDDMLTQAPIDDPLTLGEADMLDFFGIGADSMEEFAAVTCANGISAQEIVLVKAADEDAAPEVMEKLLSRLESRAAQAEGYLPDQHAIITECQVYQHGEYVAMIIHPEHEALEALYMEYVSGSK